MSALLTPYSDAEIAERVRAIFAGSWYMTIKQAAYAWSQTALPDASVIGADEDPAEAARELERYWHTESQKTEDPASDAVTEAEWREACRDALVDRIKAYRSGSAAT